jgi:hypothetical protein
MADWDGALKDRRKVSEQASCRSTLHRDSSGPPLCHRSPVITFRDPDKDKA